MPGSELMAALDIFDATEANLLKAERVWSEMNLVLSTSAAFGPNPIFDDLARTYRDIVLALPLIDGRRPAEATVAPEDIAQAHLDAAEIDEPGVYASVARMAEELGQELADYRHRMQSKRRALVRDALVDLIDAVDADVRGLDQAVMDQEPGFRLLEPELASIRTHVAQIEVLIGSNPRPARWSDLRRHLHFGMVGDIGDIIRMDWPAAKEDLRGGLYGENEPLPVPVGDLADLVARKPSGGISQALVWSKIGAEDFERLVFNLISTTPGYENPEWLMLTNAPDRGRDLSVTRVTTDPLSGVQRRRVIIQCKHWLSKSVAVDEISKIVAQMELWPDPPVDVVVFATTGRFTPDAVAWVEAHNHKRRSPQIELWADSHLENLLAARPDMIAAFKLR